MIVNNFSAEHGLDNAYILGLATPASWAGLLGSVVWAWFVDKFGTRKGMLVTGILGGVSYMRFLWRGLHRNGLFPGHCICQLYGAGLFRHRGL